jgi:hypothetical protein
MGKLCSRCDEGPPFVVGHCCHGCVSFRSDLAIPHWRSPNEHQSGTRRVRAAGSTAGRGKGRAVGDDSSCSIRAASLRGIGSGLPRCRVTERVGRCGARRAIGQARAGSACKGEGRAIARKASRTFCPRLRTVARMLDRIAEAPAPQADRKAPTTLRWMTEGRRSRSKLLLVGSTRSLHSGQAARSRKT